MHPHPKVGRGSIASELSISWTTRLPHEIAELLVTPAGATVAVTNNARVQVFDGISSSTVKHELVGQQAGISAATASSKGTELIAGGADGFLKWWQLDSGEEMASTQFLYYQDGEEPVTLDSRDPCDVSSVTISRGSNLVAASSGRFISIFGSGGEHLHTISLQSLVTALAWVNDSLLAAATGSSVHTWLVSNQSVKLWNALEPGVNSPCSKLLASPNGSFLAAVCSESVLVWDMKSLATSPTKKPMHTFSKHTQAGCLCWDSVSRYLAAAFGNELFVWDVTSLQASSKEIVCIGHGNTAAITSTMFQASGALLAVAADDGSILVYDSNQFGMQASSLARYIASGKISGVANRPCKGWVAWHPTGAILVAYKSGDMACLEPISVSSHSRNAAAHEGAFGRGGRGRPDRNMREPDGMFTGPGRGRGRGGFGGRGENGIVPGRGENGSMMPDSDGAGRGAGRGGRGIRMASGPGSGPGFRGNGAAPAQPPPTMNSGSSSQAAPREPLSRASSSTQPPGPPPPQQQNQQQHQNHNQQNQQSHYKQGSSSSYQGQQNQQQQQQQLQSNSDSKDEQGYDAQGIPTAWAPPHMRWPPVPPVPYLVYGQYPPSPMAPAPGPMTPFMTPVPPPPGGGFKPPAAPPSGSVLSTSVWSPSMGAMPPPSQMPMYMYPGQWPMAYMQQWPGYYGYYGFQPPPMGAAPMMGAPGAMPVVPAPPVPSAATGKSMSSTRPSDTGSTATTTPSGAAGGSGSNNVGGRRAGGGSARNSSNYNADTAGGSGNNYNNTGGEGGDNYTSSSPATSSKQSYPAQPSYPPQYPGPRPGTGMGHAGSSDEGVTNLYVGNLAPTVDEQALYSHFIQFGYIANVQILRDKEAGTSRGFGFVSYMHPSSAQMAMQHMNGVTLMGPFQGRPIKVSPSRKV